MGKGKNEQQMAIMFMKIDTNCDGTVDWVGERERERERELQKLMSRKLEYYCDYHYYTLLLLFHSLA